MLQDLIFSLPYIYVHFRQLPTHHDICYVSNCDTLTNYAILTNNITDIYYVAIQMKSINVTFSPLMNSGIGLHILLRNPSWNTDGTN